MSSLLTSDKAAEMLLESLGLKTGGITDLTVTFKPGDVVRVHITRLIYQGEFENFCDEVREKFVLMQCGEDPANPVNTTAE